MSLVRPKFAFILLLMGGLCLPISNSAQTADSSTKKVSHRSTKPKAAKAAKKVEEEQPPATAPAPPPPPTPEQMPSQPPTVTYEHGQLAIVAPNSTLSDILHAVRNKTGANIDIPPGANERVVSSFGPGPARDVLASLLNGSHFNYVMVGTEADPTAVAQVILTPRTGGETPPTVQAGQPGAPIRPALPAQQFPQPYPQPQIQGQAQAPGAEEPAASDGMEEDDTSQDNNADNNNDQGAPEQVQGSEGQGQNPNQPVVKTPEQLLLELQRQQQTMQQQQQQGKQPQSVSPNPQQPPQQQQQPQ